MAAEEEQIDPALAVLIEAEDTLAMAAAVFVAAHATARHRRTDEFIEIMLSAWDELEKASQLATAAHNEYHTASELEQPDDCPVFTGGPLALIQGGKA